MPLQFCQTQYGNAGRAGAAARAGSYSFSWLRGCDLYYPRCLLLGRQPMIDQVWQMLTQASEQTIHVMPFCFA